MMSEQKTTGKTLAEYQAEEAARNKLQEMEEVEKAETPVKKATKATKKVVKVPAAPKDEEQLAVDHPEVGVPQPQPVNLNLMAQSKEFTFTDANGFEWHYTLQFPGIRQVYDMLDEARMANGVLSNTLLWDQYLKYVVVVPHNLKLEDFNKRPGLAELMDEVDTFLGEAQE